MASVWSDVEKVLLGVSQPIQYVGGEWNIVRKDHDRARVKVCLAFPDAYKIGMSNAGLQILYGIVNAHPDWLAERAFTPWLDMEAKMRERKIPLFTVESHTPVREFDIVGFSLQHEMCYTNVLMMLDLAGIPLLSAERKPSDPLIICGGPCAFCAEPIADFVDLFVAGDGEDLLPAICEVVQRLRGECQSRESLLLELVKQVPSCYAPALYEYTYNADGTIASFAPRFADVPDRVRKGSVPSLEDAYYPTKPILPFGETVMDRINLEIMRGCPHICRFCQSIAIKNKVRYRSVDTLLGYAEETYRNTGLDEIALTSLSTGDYPDLDELMFRVNARFKRKKVGISVPSLHVDEKVANIPGAIATVRKTGITFAPEAGSQWLRNVIRKHIKDEHLLDGVRIAFQHGWKQVKLYFMQGLPRETDRELLDHIKLMDRVTHVGREVFGRPGQVNVTMSPFVPKPMTPFQWDGMARMERHHEIVRFMKAHTRNPHIKYKFHDPDRSFVESVFSRGDRRVGRALLAAYKNGCRFDAWDEQFSLSKWLRSFEESGIDPEWYAYRGRGKDEVLPWDQMDFWRERHTLWRDREQSYAIPRPEELEARNAAAAAAAAGSGAAAVPGAAAC
ncbi:MAG: TIGR03960 family B12-binding radical SAM protein [Planctomycetes bacterium]|nr:TIGR03960 family B12-binding radical SAM protein [Planctomycetota bacterium]